jgi:malate dehydrogenase (oxaloacetate-decarboxylating)
VKRFRRGATTEVEQPTEGPPEDDVPAEGDAPSAQSLAAPEAIESLAAREATESGTASATTEPAAAPASPEALLDSEDLEATAEAAALAAVEATAEAAAEAAAEASAEATAEAANEVELAAQAAAAAAAAAASAGPAVDERAADSAAVEEPPLNEPAVDESAADEPAVEGPGVGVHALEVPEPAILTEATEIAAEEPTPAPEGPAQAMEAPVAEETTAAKPAKAPGTALPPRPLATASTDVTGRARTRWVAPDGAWETTERGRQVINDPRLYRGVAFTEEERRHLGLVGLLPPRVISLNEQLIRSLGQYHAQPTDLAKNVYLGLLQDRNEVLFFHLLSEHLPEMLPVVYTPTIGEAIQHFSQEYRRPRGVFLSVDHPEDIELSLNATGLGPEDVDLIVATDGEAILGIGDWGVGGISISLGKLAVYTAAGGIDPGRTIAIMLDVGTNRQSLLDDPLYLGNRHPRVDAETYDQFIDKFVEIANGLFPNALLHWEDLAARNARRILNRWRDSSFTFNDDIQGTGAVALAAVLSGLKQSKGRLADQHVVIFGAGTAGVGIAEQLCDAMVADGLDPDEARGRFWLIGRNGLLVESLDALGAVMQDFQRPWARRDEEVADWVPNEDGRMGLSEVIRNVAATVLIGTSGQPGAFTENVIRNMALSCQQPIILPLSNPTELVEAEPWDIMQWTGGRALVATGSAFDPVTYAWSTHYIGQANNAFVFPGLGLGAILVGALQVTDRMLTAAAEAISAQVDSTLAGAALLPEIDAMHSTSAAVALAVARAAIEDGVARWALPDPPEQSIEAAMWKPEYRPIRAV